MKRRKSFYIGCLFVLLSFLVYTIWENLMILCNSLFTIAGVFLIIDCVQEIIENKDIKSKIVVNGFKIVFFFILIVIMWLF